MKIASWNVNGIRACVKRGFLDWLARERPDVVCLQETKCAQDQLAEEDHARIAALGYRTFWHCAERKGYSGVATFTRKPPLFVTRGVAFENGEGRILVTEHGDLTIYNVYFPNGRQREDGPDPDRLRFKLEFYDSLLHVVEEERAEGKSVVVTGDWNTARSEVDIARPKENVGVTGFTPVERETLERYFALGWVDAFRHLHPPELYDGKRPEERDYTWWTYRAGARDRNIGWRIDYHCVSPDLVRRLAAATIQPDVFGSDHCPVLLELAT
jgi:exodeoxyribonuclease III